jgi:response regulator of citrate/malate metabolism
MEEDRSARAGRAGAPLHETEDLAEQQDEEHEDHSADQVAGHVQVSRVSARSAMASSSTWAAMDS